MLPFHSRPGPSAVPVPSPADVAGSFFLRDAHHSVPILFRLVQCRGRVCLGCGRQIRRRGVRLGNAYLETYAHAICARELVQEIPELAP